MPDGQRKRYGIRKSAMNGHVPGRTILPADGTVPRKAFGTGEFTISGFGGILPASRNRLAVRHRSGVLVGYFKSLSGTVVKYAGRNRRSGDVLFVALGRFFDEPNRSIRTSGLSNALSMVDGFFDVGILSARQRGNLVSGEFLFGTRRRSSHFGSVYEGSGRRLGIGGVTNESDYRGFVVSGGEVSRDVYGTRSQNPRYLRKAPRSRLRSGSVDQIRRTYENQSRVGDVIVRIDGVFWKYRPDKLAFRRRKEGYPKFFRIEFQFRVIGVSGRIIRIGTSARTSTQRVGSSRIECDHGSAGERVFRRMDDETTRRRRSGGRLGVYRGVNGPDVRLYDGIFGIVSVS